MVGQTYSPYRKSGQAPVRPAGFGRPIQSRRGGLPQAAAPDTLVQPAADQASGLSRPTHVTPSLRGLADPAARRWIVLGAIGIVSSLLLTVGVALLSNRGVAAASPPPAAAEAPRQNRVTLVREIGGLPRAATPGTGVTAAAPPDPSNPSSNATYGAATTALRQLRRVGRAVVTPDGVRRLALGGALPFVDAAPTQTAADAGPANGTASVAFAGLSPEADDDAGTDTVFMRVIDTSSRPEVVALASPSAFDPTPTFPPLPTITLVPPTATTHVPPTATSVPPTATSVPPTPVPATATTVPPTSTPVVVTATPVPATSTPVVITATPEPTRKVTQTPESAQPAVIVVTATPTSWTNMLPSLPNPFQFGASSTPFPVPTYVPTSTPIVGAAGQAAAAQSAAQAAQQSAATQPSTSSAPAPSSVSSAPSSGPSASSASAAAAPRQGSNPAPIVSEAGTRTPTGPTARSAPQQPAAPAVPAANSSNQQAPATTAQAPQEPSILEKQTARAMVAVNTARAQAGGLPLGRNAVLDTASTLHARYDVSTGQVEGNFQAPGTPLFVGETPAARAARAAGGKPAGLERVGEVMALGETEPERVVQGWLDSVFHRVLILDLAAQSGGYGQHTAGSTTTAVLDVGGRREVANASGWFPASGATDVPTRCVCDDYAEATDKNGQFGYPVTLLLGQVRPQGLPNTARLLEGSENGTAVPAELVDAFGNPTLVPGTPLKPSTRYVVQFAWTNGPSVSWAFTTAAQ